MIQINDCKITQNGKYLSISAQVSPYTYFDNVVIHKVYIDTSDTFTMVGPSSKAIVYTIDAREAYVTHDVDGINDKMFFVWIEATGDIAENTPCDMKDNLVVTYAIDNITLFEKGACLIKSINDCDPSKAMIDFIIQLNALKVALELGQYGQAIKLWDVITTDISTNTNTVITPSCGCHG